MFEKKVTAVLEEKLGSKIVARNIIRQFGCEFLLETLFSNEERDTLMNNK